MNICTVSIFYVINLSTLYFFGDFVFGIDRDIEVIDSNFFCLFLGMYLIYDKLQIDRKLLYKMHLYANGLNLKENSTNCCFMKT